MRAFFSLLAAPLCLRYTIFRTFTLSRERISGSNPESCGSVRGFCGDVVTYCLPLQESRRAVYSLFVYGVCHSVCGCGSGACQGLIPSPNGKTAEAVCVLEGGCGGGGGTSGAERHPYSIGILLYFIKQVF